MDSITLALKGLRDSPRRRRPRPPWTRRRRLCPRARPVDSTFKRYGDSMGWGAGVRGGRNFAILAWCAPSTANASFRPPPKSKSLPTNKHAYPWYLRFAQRLNPPHCRHRPPPCVDVQVFAGWTPLIKSEAWFRSSVMICCILLESLSLLIAHSIALFLLRSSLSPGPTYRTPGVLVLLFLPQRAK